MKVFQSVTSLMPLEKSHEIKGQTFRCVQEFRSTIDQLTCMFEEVKLSNCSYEFDRTDISSYESETHPEGQTKLRKLHFEPKLKLKEVE